MLSLSHILLMLQEVLVLLPVGYLPTLTLNFPGVSGTLAPIFGMWPLGGFLLPMAVVSSSM